VTLLTAYIYIGRSRQLPNRCLCHVCSNQLQDLIITREMAASNLAHPLVEGWTTIQLKQGSRTNRYKKSSCFVCAESQEGLRKKPNRKTGPNSEDIQSLHFELQTRPVPPSPFSCILKSDFFWSSGARECVTWGTTGKLGEVSKRTFLARQNLVEEMTLELERHGLMPGEARDCKPVSPPWKDLRK
jgi:hypothetical protein